jgi:flavodoxin
MENNMKDYQKKKNSSGQFMLRNLTVGIIVIAFTMILIPKAFAREGILVVHTNQEDSKLVAQAVSASLDGTLLEIKDLKKRSGISGYFSSKFDSWFDRTTPIDPLHPDLVSYPLIVIVSSVKKKGQLETPISTLMKKNSLKDNMLFVVTYSELDIKRYDSYNDNASYWKRRARNKVRKWRKKSWKVSKESGAKILGHVHIATKDKTDDEIQGVASKIFNFQAENVPSWLFKADDLPTWMLANTDLK